MLHFDVSYTCLFLIISSSSKHLVSNCFRKFVKKIKKIDEYKKNVFKNLLSIFNNKKEEKDNIKGKIFHKDIWGCLKNKLLLHKQQLK